MLQVYVSAEHQRQRGERLCLPRDLHDDWREPRRRGAGEALYTAGFKSLLSQSVLLAVSHRCFVGLDVLFKPSFSLFRTSSSSVMLWPPG